VSQEARAAYERGAVVVPLMRTGGASNGEFNFPLGALERSDFATTQQWLLLKDKDAAVDASAGVVADIVAACAAGKEVTSSQSWAKEQAEAEARRLRCELGYDSRIVCILGGQKYLGDSSEALVEALAQKLGSSTDPKMKFVTGGMPGVQKTFAEHCSDGSRVWNLLPRGESSGYGRGTDINAGKDLEERKVIFGLLGDIYITVEGGPGVSQEARAAYERGAAVVPLMRTGGASSGQFDFPPGATVQLDFASKQQWSLLQDKGASVHKSAEAAASIVMKCPAKTTTAMEAQRLRSELGHDARIVCILGGTAFQGDDSKALVEAIASQFGSLTDSKLKFVTGGMSGVQETFATSFGDGVWNLLPVGQSSGYGRGTDIHAGKDLEERKVIFGLLGDIYITVEGGPGVSQEARAAYERGAAVVPLMRTGGASSGQFDFPPGALERPFFATTEEWLLLKDKDAQVDKTAEAVVDIVTAWAGERFYAAVAAPPAVVAMNAPEEAPAASSSSTNPLGQRLLGSA